MSHQWMDLYIITIAKPTQSTKLRNKMRMILVLWSRLMVSRMNLKQNEAQSARAESTHKGVN